MASGWQFFLWTPNRPAPAACSRNHEVYISYDQITVEDIAPLQDELKLNPTAVESAYLVYAIYKERWLSTLLKLEGPDVEEFAREIGAHAGSLVALHRKLKRLENFPFMVSKLKGGDVVDRIMEYLDKGINVVLEFGQQDGVCCAICWSPTSSRGASTRCTSKRASVSTPPSAPKTSRVNS